MSKVLVVFGATGNQGGSVINAVLSDPGLSKEFKVRAITRDASKPAAKALENRGVEVVSADMSSEAAAAPAVQGAHTVFLVTNFWESMSAEREVSQGKAVTNASKAAGVQHLIFSSLIDVTEASNGRLSNVSHFDGKSEIERYMKNSGVPATFVLPGFFMSNLFGSIKKNDDGSYSFALPVAGDKARVPLFDVVADTGKFVKAAIKHFPSQAGKRIFAAADYYSPERLVSEFSDVIGKPARFTQMSSEAYKSLLPPAVAQEMLENMLLLEEPGYYDGADLKESLSLLDEKPTYWKDFVGEHKAKWL